MNIELFTQTSAFVGAVAAAGLCVSRLARHSIWCFTPCLLASSVTLANPLSLQLREQPIASFQDRPCALVVSPPLFAALRAAASCRSLEPRLLTGAVVFAVSDAPVPLVRLLNGSLHGLRQLRCSEVAYCDAVGAASEKPLVDAAAPLAAVAELGVAALEVFSDVGHAPVTGTVDPFHLAFRGSSATQSAARNTAPASGACVGRAVPDDQPVTVATIIERAASQPLGSANRSSGRFRRSEFDDNLRLVLNNLHIRISSQRPSWPPQFVTSNMPEFGHSVNGNYQLVTR